MSLGHLVEKLDDVREVHVAVEDDVAVGLDQAKRDEEEELGRRDFFRRPYRLPHPVDVVVAELALEVQEEPSGISTLEEVWDILEAQYMDGRMQ